jgi:type II secretory pathway pseudopilin PulG
MALLRLHRRPKAAPGFTLLEASVVLTIIALLISGIIVGKSMIQSAQLQATIKQYAQYLQAIKEFQDKYRALPGDMNNAESMWGSDTSCPATTYTAKPHTATCNGDGNGRVGDSDYNGNIAFKPDESTNIPAEYELYRLWQQLADAGMIDGAYSGVPGAGGTYEATPGINEPASRVKGGGWTFMWLLNTAASTGTVYWPQSFGHVFVLGAPRAASVANAALLSPLDAMEVDSKIDDGRPGLGLVQAPRYSMLHNCTSQLNDTAATKATYNLTYTDGPGCSLIFIPGM